MAKTICHNCGADLKKVGVYEKRWITYKPKDKNSEVFVPIITAETEDTNVYCENCNKPIGSKLAGNIKWKN